MDSNFIEKVKPPAKPLISKNQTLLPQINRKTSLKEKLEHYRINREEFKLICKVLKRPPRGIEWALFSALWSEHCSYKSSKFYLKKFFSPAHQSKKVLRSFGENAGVIDLGKGEKIAFKIESHNHPSFIDPFQGAATGVGGILRDVFTMGARPIALANYLCFGSLKAPRMKHLIKGVISGISRYGNSVGIPTITGQTEFHPSYNNNILVNALALGLFSPKDPITSSKAKGVGNDVVYVGSKTGRDGLHGASMASQSFTKSENLKSTVQVGDPFFEKLLIESTLEVIQKRLVVAIQDMGAAGLLSSSFEMASKGEVGIKIFLDQVPLRDSSLGAEDILLSESQERMLLICKPENFKALKKVFRKWNLEASRIGRVEKEKKITLFWKGEQICKINPDLLVKKAPLYRHDFTPHQKKKRKPLLTQKQDFSFSGFLKEIEKQSNPNFLKLKHTLRATLLQILESHHGCSRNFIYQQYDQRIGGKTLQDASNDISILKLPHSGRLLSLVLGGRPNILRESPRDGGIDAIFYPYLELLSKGFKGLAITNCLNFGNPTDKKVMSEFVACLEGMSEMSKAIRIPIVSGNVSFYNETKSKKTSVTSTPATGLAGIKKHSKKIPSSHFVNENDDIFLVSLPQMTLQTSAFSLTSSLKGLKLKNIPYSSKNLDSFSENKENSKEKLKPLKNEILGFLDPKALSDFSKLIFKCSKKDILTASRVVGRFGWLYTLARMCIGKEKGEESDQHLKEIGCEIDTSSLSWLFKLNPNIGTLKKLFKREFLSTLDSKFNPLVLTSYFFTNTLYQVLLCTPLDQSAKFLKILKNSNLKNLTYKKIGKTKGSSLRIKPLLDISITQLRKAYQKKKTKKEFFNSLK